MEQIKEFTSAVELHGYELYELPTGYCERSGWLITGRTVTGELRHYAPLRQFPGLYRTFSSTKEEPTAIKEFANKYGLLGGNIGAIVPVPEEPAPYRQAMGEFLEDWYQEIRSMRRFVSLWDGLLAARKSGLQPQLVVQGSDSFLVGSGGSQIAIPCVPLWLIYRSRSIAGWTFTLWSLGLRWISAKHPLLARSCRTASWGRFGPTSTSLSQKAKGLKSTRRAPVVGGFSRKSWHVEETRSIALMRASRRRTDVVCSSEHKGIP